MGIDVDFFTPILVIARIPGWSAHINEQLKDNRLIRPLSKYTGPNHRKVKELQDRL
jgi:2-methylcitrate synthase